jgi:hypothetical protein
MTVHGCQAVPYGTKITEEQLVEAMRDYAAREFPGVAIGICVENGRMTITREPDDEH